MSQTQEGIHQQGIRKHASRGYLVTLLENCENVKLSVLEHNGMFVDMATGRRKAAVVREWHKHYPLYAFGCTPLSHGFDLPCLEGETLASHFHKQDQALLANYLKSILPGEDYQAALSSLEININI